MRSTIVPAQVTTVEDRIAGNLGVSQLILLLLPVFGGGLLYVFLPPFFGYGVYKVVVLVVFAVVCALMAIRIKGQIVLRWLIAIARYNNRPRYYVYSKNSLFGREPLMRPVAHKSEPAKQKVKTRLPTLPKLSTQELVKIEDIIANPQANLRFTTNAKGELRVHITEI